MIRTENNEIERRRNAKGTQTLVDEMRSKAYNLYIMNLMRQIKSNNNKTPYGIFRLTARGLAEVGIGLSSDAIRKQVKKRGGKLLVEASTREDTAPSRREDTFPVQEICADRESEVLPLYGTEVAEEHPPPNEKFWWPTTRKHACK